MTIGATGNVHSYSNMRPQMDVQTLCLLPGVRKTQFPPTSWLTLAKTLARKYHRGGRWSTAWTWAMNSDGLQPTSSSAPTAPTPFPGNGGNDGNGDETQWTTSWTTNWISQPTDGPSSSDDSPYQGAQSLDSAHGDFVTTWSTTWSGDAATPTPPPLDLTNSNGSTATTASVPSTAPGISSGTTLWLLLLKSGPTGVSLNTPGVFSGSQQDVKIS